MAEAVGRVLESLFARMSIAVLARLISAVAVGVSPVHYLASVISGI